MVERGANRVSRVPLGDIGKVVHHPRRGRAGRRISGAVPDGRVCFEKHSTIGFFVLDVGRRPARQPSQPTHSQFQGGGSGHLWVDWPTIRFDPAERDGRTHR